MSGEAVSKIRLTTGLLAQQLQVDLFATKYTNMQIIPLLSDGNISVYMSHTVPRTGSSLKPASRLRVFLQKLKISQLGTKFPTFLQQRQSNYRFQNSPH
jgi:hypothetical protein